LRRCFVQEIAFSDHSRSHGRTFRMPCLNSSLWRPYLLVYIVSAQCPQQTFNLLLRNLIMIQSYSDFTFRENSCPSFPFHFPLPKSKVIYPQSQSVTTQHAPRRNTSGCQNQFGVGRSGLAHSHFGKEPHHQDQSTSELQDK